MLPISYVAPVLIGLQQVGLLYDQAYLYTGVVDVRKFIDGLAVLVESCLELNPTQSSLFVFCSRG